MLTSTALFLIGKVLSDLLLRHFVGHDFTRFIQTVLVHGRRVQPGRRSDTLPGATSRSTAGRLPEDIEPNGRWSRGSGVSNNTQKNKQWPLHANDFPDPTTATGGAWGDIGPACWDAGRLPCRYREGDAASTLRTTTSTPGPPRYAPVTYGILEL